MVKDYYGEIDKAISRIENHEFKIHDEYWCVDRIDWCWKWRKITKEQMESLADRMCAIFDSGNMVS